MKSKALFISLAVIGMFLAVERTAYSGHTSTPPVATVLNVDRTDDTGSAMACTPAPNDCSLRGAVRASNANPASAEVVIQLAASTTYNLTLTNTTQENAALTGDLDLLPTNHPITIRGGGSEGANATVISASGINVSTSRDRVFHIVTGGFAVAFADLAIANGRAGDDGTAGVSTLSGASQTTVGTGGCVLNNGLSLTLQNVVVRNCSALGKGDHIVNEHTTLDARGGGLASVSPSSTVTISESRFAENSASGGNGGIFNNGNGSGAQGGSIYFTGGTLSVTGSRIESSSATGGNGGNQDQNGQTNGGFGGSVQGGGLWAGGGSVSIHESTFAQTTAAGGRSGTGGNGANPGGDASGGAIYSLANMNVSRSTFTIAKAEGGDGGHAFGTFCFGAHNAGDGGGARGGAILADGGTLAIRSSTFANNSSRGGNGGNGGQTNGGLNCGMHGAGGVAYGGAITNANAATVNIDHSTISSNEAIAGNTGVNQGGANKPPRPAAEGTGGGIRVGPGTVTIANTIIAGNTAANGLGNAAGAPVAGPNVDGPVTSGGHNLLGVATEATGFTGTGDKTGANAMLSPLGNNGGPTQTMAPSVGSPAIDSAVAGGETADQRGSARTLDDPSVVNAPTSDGTDIGAVEGGSGPDCNLCCPMDINVRVGPRQRGTIVHFKQPLSKGCGRVKCNRLSGSFFPIGVTIVTCQASGGQACSFRVTVTRGGSRPL